MQPLLFLGVGGAAIAAFSVIALMMLRVHPLCCGDNVYIAIAAKNFGMGDGYVSSFPDNGYARMGLEDPTLLRLPFDPNVSTGGPSQFLSAVFQRIAPGSLVAADLGGIVTRGVTLVLLLAVWPLRSLGGALLFASVPWFLFVLAHATHATLFTGLGDLSAALFAALGVATFHRGLLEKRDRLLDASIGCLFAAYLTKLVAASYVALFLLGAGILLATQREWRTLARLTLIGFALVALSELAVALATGGDGYWVNKQALLHAASENRARGGTLLEFEVPSGHGFVDLRAMAIVSLGIALLPLLRHARAANVALAWSILAAWLFVVQNAGLASVNPRYVELPGATLCAVTVLALAAWSRPRPEEHAEWRAPARVSLSLLLVLGLSLSGEQARGAGEGLWMLDSARRTHLIPMRRDVIHSYAAHLETLSDAPVTATRWQHAVDAEFLAGANDSGRVQPHDAHARADHYRLLDERWATPVEMEELRNSCETSFERGRYAVFRCDPSFAPAEE